MTDPKKPSLDDLLSNFALGPAWARGETEKKDNRFSDKKDGKREFRDGGQKSRDGGRDYRDGDRKGGKFEDGKFKGKRPLDKGGKFGAHTGGKFAARQDQTPPANGVRVTILPAQQAVHLIVKEVQQVARVYSLFDVASTLLSKRDRCTAIFELKENLPPMWRCKSGDALLLTREEAQAHLWHSEAKAQYLDEETIDVDPPSGNFQSVAKCGISGRWLGPPNFHTYQTELHRLHRERFSNMPFEAYASKVQTERGEEAVNAWLATMTKKTRWRSKAETSDEAWTDDVTQAQRLLVSLAFENHYEQTHRAELLASASGHQLSPPLRVSLKLAFNHASKHAAMLIPSICKAIETEHLPVFKRKGKLYTGPVRPHPLPADATLAPRPAKMVEWIRANTPGAKLAGLWQEVLPEGGTAPPAEYAADLFWLLQQGHILLYMDDTLVVQELREQPEPKAKTEQPKKQATQPTQEQAKPKAEDTKSEEPKTELEVGMTAEEAETVADLSPGPEATEVETSIEEGQECSEDTSTKD